MNITLGNTKINYGKSSVDYIHRAKIENTCIGVLKIYNEK